MTRKKKVGIISFLATVFSLLTTLPIHSQSGTPIIPNLRIVVVDTQQHPIPGAACTMLKPDSVAVTIITDVDGAASFPGLTNGKYVLTISKKGFEAYSRNDVVVGPPDSREIRATLNPAVLSATVDVENPAQNVQSVESGASTPAGNMTRSALERLPLATKRVDEAIPLVPGVIRSSDGQISINGANEQQSAFHVNGLNAADPASGNFRLNLPIDAVESVQVFRHPYSAEYGQFTGGLTNIETRRGGDKWRFEINDFLPDFRFINGKIVGVRDDSPHVN